MNFIVIPRGELSRYKLSKICKMTWSLSNTLLTITVAQNVFISIERNDVWIEALTLR